MAKKSAQAKKAKKVDLVAVLDRLTGRCDAQGNILGPRRENTRQRIVDATTSALLDRGYQLMRVDDVAKSSRVSRPTLYSYFGSKPHLLFAAMAEESRQQLPTLAPLFDTARPAKDRLVDWIRQGVLFVDTAPLHARLVLDREPEVMTAVMTDPLARQVLGANPELDKAKLFAGLIKDAFPNTFSDAQANELAALMRMLGHMSPSLANDDARFGLSVNRAADLISDLVTRGMQSHTTRKGQS